MSRVTLPWGQEVIVKAVKTGNRLEYEDLAGIHKRFQSKCPLGVVIGVHGHRPSVCEIVVAYIHGLDHLSGSGRVRNLAIRVLMELTGIPQIRDVIDSQKNSKPEYVIVIAPAECEDEASRIAESVGGGVLPLGECDPERLSGMVEKAVISGLRE